MLLEPKSHESICNVPRSLELQESALQVAGQNDFGQSYFGWKIQRDIWEYLDSGGLSQLPFSHQGVLGAAIKLPYRSTGTACSLKSGCNKHEERPFRIPIP